MPSMGEGVNEATLVKWLKQKGDLVAQDEPLFEVSTDKVDTEIPAPESGILVELMAAEGSTVQVDQVLAILGSESDLKSGVAADTPPPQAKKPESAPREPAFHQAVAADLGIAHGKTEAKTYPTSDRNAPHPGTRPPGKLAAMAGIPRQQSLLLRSSPIVRKMAKEKGIDLNLVVGSGLQGRITKQDLEAYLRDTSRRATTRKQPGSDRRPEAGASETVPASTSTSSEAPQPSKGQSLVVRPTQAQLATTLGEDGLEYLEGVAVRREKMTKMRSLIADHMVESVRTSPHVTTVFEVNLHRMVQLREKTKQEFEKREGFKLTYTPFLIHAAVQALKLHPIVNASLDGDDILFKTDINIGCAVALENGLIVPVIKKAGELSLNGIARRLNDLVTRARSKKLKPDDVKGGTFSITNPGGFGSITSNPIINQPQLAILGIGAIVKKPVVIEDDAIAVRPMMMISLTFDHRVIDGEGGARYLADLKKICESYDEKPF